MIGIADIAYVLPPQRIRNAAHAERLGVPLATLERRIGVQQTSRRAADQDTSDLAAAAAEALFARGAVEREQVDCLVVVTQNPDGRGLPHCSALVHARLGLAPDCAVFDIGLGCSGYVYGLSIVRSFMQSNGLRHGLLITADPYSKIVDPDDKRTALLFGDGAAATLLNDRPTWRLGRFDFGTEGRYAGSLKVDAASGRLFMDGRAVLQFSMSVVPGSLRRALDINGLSPQQIDRVVLHQGSRVIVENIGEALGLADRTRFHAAEYGNTVSSSIPIVLADHLLPEDRHVALSGFGVGLSWASTVLSRVPAP
ncbi:ketoacyl-ACP synthase III [Solimonas sp. SE-A11]|uniref:ketoacyl-ACP synthase III n=1 Tax=Solimonas sp. SE-A11 TaxID=3054954 RepID=UPI00259CBD2D|nr:ketoacyl-ACP synthase III [Solimonas sp. SE-A11]MDM4771442.1 ketoacyl-ACP synthase III [Solimonas sp. SE-A11]